MKKIRIHLSQPFEELLSAVLSLPKGENSDRNGDGSEDLKQVVRGLYEAANGRHVETALGFIPIAPPIAPFLKESDFEVSTQRDFLVEAAARVILCPSKAANEAESSEPISHRNGEFYVGSGEAMSGPTQPQYPSTSTHQLNP